MSSRETEWILYYHDSSFSSFLKFRKVSGQKYYLLSSILHVSSVHAEEGFETAEVLPNEKKKYPDTFHFFLNENKRTNSF